MLPMPKVFASLSLSVSMLGFIACAENSIVQSRFAELTVTTPDSMLATPQPVSSEEVAMRLTSTSIADATATAEMQRIVVAIAAILTAQPTATPTSTAAPNFAATLTAQPMVTLTPTATWTSSLLTATVNTAALNLRTGPGTPYPVVQSYTQGTVVTILGKESGEQWLKVETPDGEVGWMATRYLRLSADLTNITVVETPPTPTPNR